MSDVIASDELSKIKLLKREDLASSLREELKIFPVNIMEDDDKVKVSVQEKLICGVEIQEETYKIFFINQEWKDKTSYRCEDDGNGMWSYYLETIDECIWEVKRIVIFEANRNKQKKTFVPINSELRQVISVERFESIYRHFMEQADLCVEKGTTAGSSQTPYGFPKKPKYGGKNLSLHFGQGAVSASPYLNWWVVSLYYLPKSGDIIMGIEVGRYSHLMQMSEKPIRYSKIGNKKRNVAVFYSTNTKTVDYKELYDKFIAVCEEIMQLGLE